MLYAMSLPALKSTDKNSNVDSETDGDSDIVHRKLLLRSILQLEKKKWILFHWTLTYQNSQNKRSKDGIERQSGN